MADSTDFSETSASALSNLTLRVLIDGQRAEEKYLQHGLTLGRLESSAVYINHPEVERLHARVHQQRDGTMLLECCEQRLRIKTSDGAEVHSLALKPGIAFHLGNAVIRCARRDVAVGIDPWKVFCPLCHANLADLSHDADRCPACGREIAYFPSPQEGQRLQGANEGGFEGWIPRSVGPYRGLKFVAHGGMGIVLFGLHQANPEPAAVKLIKRSFEQGLKWQDRFQQEIAILKPLRHPNIVRFREDGIDDKLLWLATDWVAGEPLSEYISRHRRERKPVPTEEAMAILSQIAVGLQYLHGIPVVHRDLKPSNVLLGRDGGAKLVDLGIARALGTQALQSTRRTHTGAVLGTAHYMSPEQEAGHNVDSASDIYSFGVMAFELFAGCRPSFGAKLPDGCPEPFRSIIARCLQAAPQDRPTTCEVANAVSGPVVPLGKPARPTPTIRRIWPPTVQSRSRIASTRRVALSVVFAFSILSGAMCYCVYNAYDAHRESLWSYDDQNGQFLLNDFWSAAQSRTTWYGPSPYGTVYPYGSNSKEVESELIDDHDRNIHTHYASMEARQANWMEAAAVCAIALLIVFSVWLYAVWSVLPPHLQSPLPGKAAGLLFVPVFNLYWTFRVVPGLSNRLNEAIRERDSSLQPRTGFWLGIVAALPAIAILLVLRMIAPDSAFRVRTVLDFFAGSDVCWIIASIPGTSILLVVWMIAAHRAAGQFLALSGVESDNLRARWLRSEPARRMLRVLGAIALGCGALACATLAAIQAGHLNRGNPAKAAMTLAAWGGLAVLFAAAASLCARKARKRLRADDAQCVKCGYDLRLNTSGICPECGIATTAVAANESHAAV